MKKLYSLKFNNPNNAAMSLHTLAEWVRVGDVKIVSASDEPALDYEGSSADLMLGFADLGNL